MAELHLLHLDPNGLTVHFPDGHALHFPPSAEGQRAFATHLHDNIRARLKLLVDLPEEQFTIEALPALHGSDRRRLIARRRRQAEADSPFVTVLPLGRLADEPPGESLLLATLTRPETLQSWLDVLHAEGVSLTGAYSAAFVGMALLPHLGASPPSAVLVAWSTPAGLRVSYYAGGKLRFSRLTSVGSQPFAQGPQEIQRTRQYLIAQRLLGRDTPLRIFVLAATAEHSALQADKSSTAIEYVNSNAIAVKLGANSANGSDGLPLLLRLLTRRTRIPAIEAPSIRQRESRHRLDHLGLLGAMALTGACVVIGTSNLIRLGALEAESSALQAHIVDAQTRVQASIAEIPATPLPPATIHAAHARVRALLDATNLDAALHLAARALDRFPSIELTRLDWSVQPDDAQPHPSLRLHLAVPANAPPSISERFVQTLGEITRAKVMVERATINPNNGIGDAPSAPTLVVRLDFATAKP